MAIEFFYQIEGSNSAIKLIDDLRANFKYIAYKHKNGIISMVVEWSCENENSYKLKYVSLESKSFGYYTVSASFTFDNLCPKRKYNQPILTIGLEDPKKKIKYNPFHYENIKYGVIVYFTPENFLSNSKIISEQFDG